VAAPTFVVSESNGATPTITDNVPSTQFAATDTASAAGVALANPVADGANSYEKWQRFKLTGAATTGIISTSVYYGAAVQDNAGSTGTVNLMFTTNHSYVTPVATASTIATTNANTATSAPGTSITAPANTVSSYSGYVTEQLQFTGSAAGGPCIFASPYRTFQVIWD
jgi:hypothetical protein